MGDGKLSYREITADDMAAIFEVRLRIWHNLNGAEEMAQMGITHETVIALMENSHRGWLAGDG